MNVDRFLGTATVLILVSFAVLMVRFESSWTTAAARPADVAPVAATLRVQAAFGPYGSDAIATATPTELVGPYRPVDIPPPPTPTPGAFSIRQAVPTPTPRPVATLPPAPQAAAVRPQPPAPTGSIVEWLVAAGWPAELIPEASAVAWCESNHRPGARNGPYLGLFQLSPLWFSYSGEPQLAWDDPVVNARAALATYWYDINRGHPAWKQWECKPWHG